MDWPDTVDGQYARHYLTPLMAGTANFVANAEAQLGVIRHRDFVFPFTQSTYQPGQSYVVSPRAHYIDYAAEEARRQYWALPLVVAGLKPLIGQGLDRVIMVNNWLLSTNLYPAGAHEAAVPVLETLLQRFPDQPILFRSVDACSNPKLFQELLQRGCRPVLSRSVYFQNVHAPGFWKRNQIRKDLSRLKRSGYELRKLKFPEDASCLPRVLQLYNLLYLEKYCRLNPQLTLEFLTNALRFDLLSIQVLERDGRIDGTFGNFRRNGIMTQPLFGFDTTLPRELSLYAHLSAGVLLEARRTESLINASAGAAHFKGQRGGKQVLEFNMVYHEHLPFSSRRGWLVLEKLLGPAAQRLILQHGL